MRLYSPLHIARSVGAMRQVSLGRAPAINRSEKQAAHRRTERVAEIFDDVARSSEVLGSVPTGNRVPACFGKNLRPARYPASSAPPGSTDSSLGTGHRTCKYP